jgi:hypothetical protein
MESAWEQENSRGESESARAVISVTCPRGLIIGRVSVGFCLITFLFGVKSGDGEQVIEIHFALV